MRTRGIAAALLALAAAPGDARAAGDPRAAGAPRADEPSEVAGWRAALRALPAAKRAPLDRLDAALEALEAGAPEPYPGRLRDAVLLALEDLERAGLPDEVLDRPYALWLRARALLVLEKSRPAEALAARLVERSGRAAPGLELVALARMARYDALDRRLAAMGDPAGDPRAAPIARGRREALEGAAAALRDAIARDPTPFRRFVLAKALALRAALGGERAPRDEARRLFEGVARGEVERLRRDRDAGSAAFLAQAILGWAECEDDPEGRAGLLRAAVSADPRNHLAWLALGRDRRRQGALREARDALLRALALARDPAAWARPMRLYFHGALDRDLGRDRGRFRQGADGIGQRIGRAAIHGELARVAAAAARADGRWIDRMLRAREARLLAEVAARIHPEGLSRASDEVRRAGDAVLAEGFARGIESAARHLLEEAGRRVRIEVRAPAGSGLAEPLARAAAEALRARGARADRARPLADGYLEPGPWAWISIYARPAEAGGGLRLEIAESVRAPRTFPYRERAYAIRLDRDPRAGPAAIARDLAPLLRE